MKLQFLLMFLIVNNSIFSQNIYLPESSYIMYPMMVFSFKNNEIQFWEAGTVNRDGSEREPEKNLNGIYHLEYIDKMNFINIQWENNQNERYLILYNNELCYLYKTDGNVYFRGFKIRRGAPGELCFPANSSNVQITSSSYLVEGNTTYSADKLYERIGECWAEGVEGQGINETLYLRTLRANSLHISTGFVSFNRPYLFNYNSRPRKIELYVRNKFQFIIELKDTPNFQTINLPEQLDKDDILELKILEVYTGIRYEDTCINIILLDWVRY
ncbi:MAG: hypothetical protein LBQ93_07110 [Treponema sp.]|jgi:hypothetical protein|nr:hypothetical protein [Treponema sp.]